MDQNETRTLARLAERRFRNFSEAAYEVLEALTGVLPGVIALGRMDNNEHAHRVIEVRGGGLIGVEEGTVLPPSGREVDDEFLRSLGAQDWLSDPLEMSDGRIVGVLCAIDPGSDSYTPEHAALLGVGARLLAHEWESVELRSELRRLRGRVNAGPRTDADTGLPDREGFTELLAQEWQAVEQGTAPSVLIVCQVDSGDRESGNGSVAAKDRLALKLVADVLGATTRGSDRVGRVGEMSVGAILVNCEPKDAPSFIARFLAALDRVTEGRDPKIEVSCGVQPLADASTPQEVLDLAEIAAGYSDRGGAPDLTPEAAQ